MRLHRVKDPEGGMASITSGETGMLTVKCRHIICDVLVKISGDLVIEPGTLIELRQGAYFYPGSTIKVEHERSPLTVREWMR